MGSHIPDIGSLFIPKDMGSAFIRKLLIFVFLAILVILMGSGFMPI